MRPGAALRWLRFTRLGLIVLLGGPILLSGLVPRGGAAPAAGIVSGDSTRVATPPLDLRVMTFNIRYGTAADGENRWDHRKDLLLATITAFDPDLLGTQECLQLQAEFLETRLPGYGFVGVGRDDGALQGEMCAIFYRKSRFEKLDQGHFWLSETPEVPGSKSWDAALTRIASWVKLRVRGERPLTLLFFDTHFDHMGAEARTRSAELLQKKIGELCQGSPAIVAGDFNAPADPAGSGPYRVLMTPVEGRPVLIDVYRALHPPAGDQGTYHAFTGRGEERRIDWILATSSWRPVNAEIVSSQRDGRYPSDHFPVTAVLRVDTAHAFGGSGSDR